MEFSNCTASKCYVAATLSLQVEHTLTPYVNCDVTMETYCNFFTGRMLFLTPNQQCQSTEDNKAQRGADIKNIYMSAAIVIRQLPSAIGHQLILIVGHSRYLCSTVSGWLVLPRVWGVMCGLCRCLAHSTTGSTYNEPNKKLCYRRRTVWRDVPIKILPTAAKQCSKRS